MIKLVQIYGLFDPDSGELRYVGKANDAQKRLRRHIDDRNIRRPVCAWVKSLVDRGKMPVSRVLEEVEASQWEEAERRLIALHRKTANLLNLADGGAAPHQTKEQRKKAARASNAVQKVRPEAWKRFVQAKQELARLYKRFLKETDSPKSMQLAAILRFRMRLDAARAPELYGTWANL